MQDLGYKTHAIGKWHLGLWKWEYTPSATIPPPNPALRRAFSALTFSGGRTFRGYDSFLGYYSGSQDYYTHKDSGFDLHLDIGKPPTLCSAPQLVPSKAVANSPERGCWGVQGPTAG